MKFTQVDWITLTHFDAGNEEHRRCGVGFSQKVELDEYLCRISHVYDSLFYTIFEPWGTV